MVKERLFFCTVHTDTGPVYCFYAASSPGDAMRRARESVTNGVPLIHPPRRVKGVEVEVAKLPAEEYLKRAGGN